MLVYCLSPICNWGYQGELGFCCIWAELCINVYGRVWLYTRENSKTKDVDKDRCRYCREIGHWVKDCPQKKKDQEKGDTEDTFTGLSEITQDFYGTRATDMFHGITDIYVESDEKDNILEPEENDKLQDQEEYLN